MKKKQTLKQQKTRLPESCLQDMGSQVNNQAVNKKQIQFFLKAVRVRINCHHNSSGFNSFSGCFSSWYLIALTPSVIVICYDSGCVG